MTEVIRTGGLTKRYGGLLAVDGVDLDVHEGDLYGFLGPNGSGKTTTIRMLLGLVSPTSRHDRGARPADAGATRAPCTRSARWSRGLASTRRLSGARNLTIFDAAGPGGSRSTRKGRIGDVARAGRASAASTAGR